MMKMQSMYKPLLAACCLLLVAYGVFRYTETAQDTNHVKTEASLSSQDLMAMLSSDIGNLSSQYIEKAIEVEGTIVEITQKTGVYTLILSGHEEGAYILCEMQKNEKNKIEVLQAGDTVIVKGIFKGYLKDAVLLNCIIV